MTPGLESVTVAPGMTAPDSSRTVPPIDPTPWARAGNDTHRQNPAAKTTRRTTVAEIIAGSSKTSCRVGFGRKVAQRPAARKTESSEKKRALEYCPGKRQGPSRVEPDVPSRLLHLVQQ